MLNGIRVLDCTDANGHLAGLLLAQLGAEVVLAEPADGVSSRRSFPVADGKGLRHEAFNRGKQSVIVDGATRSRLAAAADVVLWSGSPLALPFDPAQRRPEAVLATLSPFGLSGPKVHWPATDITLAAASGVLHITGDADRPPLRMSVPQAWHQGALDTAVGVMLALAERQRSGLGQHVDVSVQRAYLQATFGTPLLHAWQRTLVQRAGHGLGFGPLVMRFGYPARDGEVSITQIFGPTLGAHIGRLFAWIHAEGGCSAELGTFPWGELMMRVLSGQTSPGILDEANAAIAAWTARRTCAELDALARERNVLLQSVSTLADVLHLPHLAARGAWEIDSAGMKLPGAFAKLSATPMQSLHAAPDLGASPEPTWPVPDASTTAAAVASPATPRGNPGIGSPAADRTLPLAGLVVLDITWSYAGPMIGQTLARAGARVIKIESTTRLDVARTVTFRTLEDIPDHTVAFHNTNAMKESVLLDITSDAGRAVLLDLAEHADVVIDSFSAGVMDRLGIGHGALSGRNPAIITLASSLTGETGPLAVFPGYGNLAAALYGFAAVTAWPGRPVAAPYLAYTDVVSSRFALVALLGALAHRDATGQGQHIDLSQGECSLNLLADALLAEQHGLAFPLGNDDAEMSPHAVYPCAGDDRWVAIACTDDAAWARLAVLVGRAELAGLDLAGRRSKCELIDAAICAWSSVTTAADAEAALIARHIAAHRVADAKDMMDDPQLRSLGHWVTVDRFGDIDAVVEASRISLSATPMVTTARAPMLGEHTFDVLTGLLGYSDERVAALAAAGVLE